MIGFGAGVLAPQIDPEGCERLSCDVLIVGCGVAGLYAALGLPESLSVEMLCKEDVASCDSMLAQGGICVQRDDDDYDPWFEDTLRAGHYENRRESVDIMIRESRALIDDLMSLGVTFDRTPTGELDYTREGAHSRPRILHAADLTGAEITTKLREAVERRSNIGIHEYTTMRDLLVEEGRCVGVLATDGANEPLMALARDTVLATGGVGGLYPRSTNFRSLTGDGCRICQQAGVELEHMDYVQIHPTSLYTPNPDRAFLISESCRGEGRSCSTPAAGASPTSCSRATWSRRPSIGRWSATARRTCGSRSRVCPKGSSPPISRTSIAAACRRATISPVSTFLWCRPSIT